MPLKRPKYRFQRGKVTMALMEEERLYVLKMVKLSKPKGEFEKRLLLRITRRCMGYTVHNYPLHEPKECPICERTFAFIHFDAHHYKCKQKRSVEKRLPPIDQEVYDMLQEGR